MRRPRLRLALLVVPALAGCGASGLWRHQGDPGTARLFQDRVWADTAADAPKGAFRAFLSDGTLIMGSCGEGYRLAKWRWTDTAAVAWEEDGKRIDAEIGLVGSDQLVLVLRLSGGPETLSYRAAETPLVCPDSR